MTDQGPAPRFDLNAVIALVLTLASSICVVALVLGAVINHEPLSQALSSVLGAMLGVGLTWIGVRPRKGGKREDARQRLAPRYPPPPPPPTERNTP